MSKLPKRLFLLLTLLGCAFLLIGFGYDVVFVNIPYQDAPPLLLRQQDFHAMIARRFYWAGFIILVFGLLGICAQGVKWIILLVLRSVRKPKP